jgi:hypothetical protein
MSYHSIKVKLFLYLINQVQHNKKMRQWRYSSIVLDLSTKWRLVVRFMPWSLYPLGNSPPGTHWIGGWLSSRAILDIGGEKNLSVLPGIEPQPFNL